MATSLSIPVFEFKPYGKLPFEKSVSLKMGEEVTIGLPEINNGPFIVQLVNKKGLRGNPPRFSGPFAYLSVLHNNKKLTDVLELKPSINGVGIVRTATAHALSKDGLYQIYLKNTRTVPLEDPQEEESYHLFVEYNSNYPIKTKTIPMSFWQRAFDEFWNDYKPVENIKLDYNHDTYADQYSVGSILYLVDKIRVLNFGNDVVKRIMAADIILKYNIPSSLINDRQTQVLAKYHRYFNDLKFINQVYDVIPDARAQFVGRISRIAGDHPNDAEFRNEVYIAHDRAYNFIPPFFINSTFRRRSSNKLILSLKQDIADFYNVNANFKGVTNVVFKMFDADFYAQGIRLASAKINNLNVVGMMLSTIKNTPFPGFKLNVNVESLDEIPGKAEIEGSLIGNPVSINITSLKIDPSIRLISSKSTDESSLNQWGKNYGLELTLNFKMTPSVQIEYPEVSGHLDFNRDDLIDFDLDVTWIRTNLDSYMNTIVCRSIENYLNKGKKKIIELLLGEAYPIIEIKQVNDNMVITYVGNPEDVAFNQLAPLAPFVPATRNNNLAKIDHIIVLMMENRSFDQMLGYLKVKEGRNDVDGLTGEEFNMHIDSFSHSNKKYQVFHSSQTNIFDDPCHAYDCMKQQIGTSMDGFVDSMARKIHETNPEKLYERLGNVMRYYGKAELPTYDYLANEFAICDKWYCSHPGQTQPNRFITYTGKLNKDRSGKLEVDNPNFGDFTPLETHTIFDYLTQCKVSWKVFEHGYSLMRLFSKYTFDTTNVVDFNNPKVGFKASLRTIPGSTKTNFPSVAFIEPDYIDVPPGNDDHPPADVKNGQKFIAKVIQDLQESGIWEKSALIITYDESGGFYDHVMPPNNAVPLKPGITRLGPRVPSFVISPYVPAKTVSHEIFDHVSILATIVRRFIRPDLHAKLDLGPRLSTAKDIGSILSLSTPRKNVRKIAVPTYSVAFPEHYRMRPPGIKSNDFHDSLFGYRLILGYPPK